MGILSGEVSIRGGAGAIREGAGRIQEGEVMVRGGAAGIQGRERGIRSGLLPWVTLAMLLQGGIIDRAARSFGSVRA